MSEEIAGLLFILPPGGLRLPCGCAFTRKGTRFCAYSQALWEIIEANKPGSAPFHQATLRITEHYEIMIGELRERTRAASLN